MVTDLWKVRSVFSFSVKQPTGVPQDYFGLPDAEQDGDTIFLDVGYLLSSRRGVTYQNTTFKCKEISELTGEEMEWNCFEMSLYITLLKECDIDINTVNMYHQENVNSRKLKRDYSALPPLYTHFPAYMPTIITGIISERPAHTTEWYKKKQQKKNLCSLRSRVNFGNIVNSNEQVSSGNRINKSNLTNQACATSKCCGTIHVKFNKQSGREILSSVKYQFPAKMKWYSSSSSSITS